MFEEKGLDCIFLETNMGMKKQYHMVYECIPLPREMGDMAPIYFKVFINSFFVYFYYFHIQFWVNICLVMYFLKYSHTKFYTKK